MSHFYARIPESARRTIPTARGHHAITTEAAGWGGCVETRIFIEGEVDRFEVYLRPWQNSGGEYQLIAEGVLDSNAEIARAGLAIKAREAA